jgi:hypothetical protein
MVTALTCFTSPAFMASDEKFTFDPNTADFMQDLGYGLFVAALILASLLLLSVYLIGYRSRFVPLWVCWISVPAAIALLFFFFPVFVFLAWVLIVSVVMLIRTWRSARSRGARSGSCRLDVEPHVEDVTVLDDVGLPLETLEAALCGLRVRAGLDEIAPTDHLGADEPLCDVRVDARRCIERGATANERPRARLLVARGEERYEPNRLENLAHDVFQRGRTVAEFRRLLLR